MRSGTQLVGQNTRQSRGSCRAAPPPDGCGRIAATQREAATNHPANCCARAARAHCYRVSATTKRSGSAFRQNRGHIGRGCLSQSDCTNPTNSDAKTNTSGRRQPAPNEQSCGAWSKRGGAPHSKSRERLAIDAFKLSRRRWHGRTTRSAYRTFTTTNSERQARS